MFHREHHFCTGEKLSILGCIVLNGKSRLLLAGCMFLMGLGIVIHTGVPSSFRSDVAVASDGNPLIKTLDPAAPSPMKQTFYISISISYSNSLFVLPTINTTFAIVNRTELDRFTNGTAFEDLVPVKGATAFQTTRDANGIFIVSAIDFTIIPGDELSLIVVTNSSTPVAITLYSSVTPVTYRPGLALLSGGFLATIIVLAWSLRGWKRQLVIGAGINTAIFWLRASSLATMVSVPAFLTNVLNVEIYADFQFQTFIWTSSFASGIGLYAPAMPISYPFPPLYAYMSWLCNLLPLPAWKLAIPILGFTILTGLLVHRIVLELTRNEKRAGIAMLLFYLNPFILVYASYAWLTPPMFVFFVVLAFYLAIKNKGAWPAVALGIAIASKQYAIVFFPLLLLVMLRSRPRMSLKQVSWNVFTITAACCGTITIASLPYIAVDPAGYLETVFLANAGGAGQVIYLASFCNFLSHPVTFNSFFFFINMPSTFTTAIGWVLAYNVPLVACGAGVYIAFFLFARKLERNDAALEKMRMFAEVLFLSMLLVVFLHIFYSRGAYKYYFILLAPFISIFHDQGDLALEKISSTPGSRFDWRWLVPSFISLGLVLCNRYVYLMLVLAWGVYWMLKKRGSIDRLMRLVCKKGRSPAAFMT
jgi:hypothetical protein